ncbi:MAG TPA: fumarylacetoacetate hydrolase family protein [Novosphingobium sp.]|nr:fumarylacetoacetate hydrolase family protein [Novosphingobium sp.]
MRICRYQVDRAGPVKVGIVEGASVFDVTAATDLLPSLRWPFPPGDQFIANLDLLRPAMLELKAGADPLPVDEVLLKNPVANPGKFICGAGNHKIVLEHGHHPRHLGMLHKMTSAAAGASDDVVLRWQDRVCFHEIELAIIIGKSGTLVPRERAFDHIAGYAIGLDMTLQKTPGQQNAQEFDTFRKSFDTFGVIGPWLVTLEEIPDPSILNFRLTVNGELRTQDTIGNLALDVPGLVEHVTSIMTVHPGDVIFTGTPPMGLGPVVAGDVMHASMDIIGEMSVRVVAGAPGRQPAYTD